MMLKIKFGLGSRVVIYYIEKNIYWHFKIAIKKQIQLNVYKLIN